MNSTANTDSSSLADPTTSTYAPRAARFDWSWPALAAFIMVAAFAMGTDRGREVVSSALDRVSHATVPQALGQTVMQDRVLIATSNLQKQRNVMLTMSPRGLEPLLARSVAEANALIPRFSAQIRYVVIDENLPEASAMAKSLRKSLPANRVIMLKASSRPEDVGRLLVGSL